MRRHTSARAAASAALAAACLVLTGCGVAMPHSGPVHETTLTGSNRNDLPPNIDPPRPKKGASAEEIVAGFLDAMTATPAVRTSVAREYLTKEASDSWQPKGMLIYGAPLSPHGNPGEQRFIDAYRVDARGAWLGPATEAESTIKFPMEFNESGELRISQPPANLLVPQTWFAARFRQVSLYFFDPTGTMLIPEPVFVPRGPQFASALVNALLVGPSKELAGTEKSFLPPDLRALVSVPVSESGVARVDLSSDTADAAMPTTTEQAEMLVSQLAWTLRQDPSIAKFKVTIDDRPLQLPGETEFSVEHGHQYAPYVGGSSTQLFGLQDGLMVGGSPQNLAPVTGPFGHPGYSLRAVATDLLAQQVAGVSSGGDALWLSSVKDSGNAPVQLMGSAEDLLRPSWDFSGRLWEVDRRSTGAVVYYLRDDRRGTEMVPLDVPGISGADVKHFLVSRDGSRLIAVIRDSASEDSIVVSRILTSGDGQVLQALAADNITDPAKPEGPIRDIAWSSPTSLSVLRPVSRQLFQVGSASVDGASGFDAFPVPVDGNVVGLAGTPVPDERIFAFEAADGDTPAALVDLAGPRSNSIEVDSRITSLSYAG
jgi:hypothetical protein